jgi:hypothetical protein
MHQIEQHGIFAAFCVVVLLILVRLVVHERITLQSSLALLGLLASMLTLALAPQLAFALAARLGFALPSNFLFTVGIGALVLLNVTMLVTLSRIELRSITLTQAVALFREKLERVEHSRKINSDRRL